jgi:hypothetical protein
MATDEFDLGEFNAGSYTESVAAKNAAENITMVLYPNDASENGKELRLRQQYFLASASLQDVLEGWERTARARLQPVRRQELLPAQRHPSELCRARTDAPADGRARPGLGLGLGDHPQRPWPTPTTRCCPRPWRSGRCACSVSSCRGCWKSSTRSTPASSPRSNARWPGDHDAWRACRSSRKATSRRSAWPTWRSSAASRSTGWPQLHSDLLQDRPVPRLSRAVAAEVQQQDQRRHPAPLAGGGQPGLSKLRHGDHRPRLDDEPRRAAGALAHADDAAFRRPGMGSSGQQGPPRRTWCGGLRCRRSTRTRCSTFR